MSYENNVLVEIAAFVSLEDTSILCNDSLAPYNNPPSGGGRLMLVDHPSKPTKIEIISYTGVTDNGDGTHTITGCARGLENTGIQQWQPGRMIFMSVTAEQLDSLALAADVVAKSGGTMSGNLQLQNSVSIQGAEVGGSNRSMLVMDGGDNILVGVQANHLTIRSLDNPTFYNGSNNYTFYHTGNKPALDDLTGVAADSALLDSLDSSQFLRSDVADVKTAGSLTLNDNVQLRLGTGNDTQLFFDGVETYLRSNAHGARWVIDGEDAGGTLRNILIGDPDGTLDAYYAGEKKFETAPSGVVVTGTLNTTDHITVDKPGSVESRLNLLNDVGGVRMAVEANGNFALQQVSASNAYQMQWMWAVRNGGVNLTHNGDKKFETTTTGATVSGGLIVTGDLTVQGTTFTVDSNTVNIGDNIIVLNADETGVPSQSAGFEIERGTSANVSLLWNEAGDFWTFNDTPLKGVTDPLDDASVGDRGYNDGRYVRKNTGDGSDVAFTTTSDLTSTNVRDAIEEVKALPSGVNWAGNTKNASFTAAKANGYMVSGASITVTLPATPGDGDVVELADTDGTWDVNPITVTGGAKTIEGGAALLDIRGDKVQLIFSSITDQWEMISAGAGFAQEIKEHTALAGSTSYVLPWTPPNATSIDVYIGAVFQPTTSYTLIGDTLSFSEVLPADLIVRLKGYALPIGVPADTSVTMAKLDAEVSARVTAGRKNYLINGNFDIWQRGVSFSDSASGIYTADRWIASQASITTVTQEAFTIGQSEVPNNPEYYLRIDRTSASTQNRSLIYQRVENVRTLAGQTATASFYAKANTSKTLKFLVSQEFGTGGSTSVTVISTDINLTTNWTKYEVTFTVPSISGKTIGDGSNLTIHVLREEDTYTTFTADIAQAQLEFGEIATPFEYRNPAEERALCARYFERVAAGSTTNGVATGLFTSGSGAAVYLFYSEKRALPAITTSTDWAIKDGTSNVAVTSPASLDIGLLGSRLVYNGLTVTAVTRDATALHALSMDAYVDIDAEL